MLLRQWIPLGGLVLVGLIAGFLMRPAPSLAAGVCDFMSGDARRVCQLATAAAQESARAEKAQRERADREASRPSSSSTGPTYGARSGAAPARRARYADTIQQSCPWSDYGSRPTFKEACHNHALYNYDKAAPLFQQACDEGDMSGCYQVARYADEGRVGKKDKAKALTFYTKVCDHGGAFACYDVARAYEIGDGVKKDPEYAAQRYKVGCDAGNKLSCGWLDGTLDKDCPIGVRLRVTTSDGKLKVICRQDAFYGKEYEVKPTEGELAQSKSTQAYFDAETAAFRKNPRQCMIHHTYVTGTHTECPGRRSECLQSESFKVEEKNTVLVNQCKFSVVVESASGSKVFEPAEYGDDFEVKSVREKK